MTRIVVGTTFTRFAMVGGPDVWGSWLRNRGPYQYFAALEIIQSMSAYDEFLQLNVEHWKFVYDDSRTSVTTQNRGRHIAAGRNMVFDYAWAQDADYVLMMDADIEPAVDTVDKLLEVMGHDVKVVGAYCPTFCQDGPVSSSLPGDTRVHLATGCTLIHKDVYRRIRFGPGDDWGFKQDMKEFLGLDQFVRHDAVVKHYPEAIPPIEDRGYDLEVSR